VPSLLFWGVGGVANGSVHFVQCNMNCSDLR